MPALTLHPHWVANVFFGPQLVRHMTRDWPATFAKLKAGLVAAQRELLARLEWRLMLSARSGECARHAIAAAMDGRANRGDTRQQGGVDLVRMAAMPSIYARRCSLRGISGVS